MTLVVEIWGTIPADFDPPARKLGELRWTTGGKIETSGGKYHRLLSEIAGEKIRAARFKPEWISPDEEPERFLRKLHDAMGQMMVYASPAVEE